MSSETPMIRQYNKIKGSYPDAILLFRLGDFYEMFYDDAKTASKVLGITLTSRNKAEQNPIPLCGVPFHSVEPYIAKLLDHGHKVAICEQIEDPKLAKGVVERKVVKVLTPGVILDSEQLREKKNNLIRTIVLGVNKLNLSNSKNYFNFTLQAFYEGNAFFIAFDRYDSQYDVFENEYTQTYNSDLKKYLNSLKKNYSN